jgi:hypothetical protein
VENDKRLTANAITHGESRIFVPEGKPVHCTNQPRRTSGNCRSLNIRKVRSHAGRLKVVNLQDKICLVSLRLGFPLLNQQASPRFSASFPEAANKVFLHSSRPSCYIAMCFVANSHRVMLLRRNGADDALRSSKSLYVQRKQT